MILIYKIIGQQQNFDVNDNTMALLTKSCKNGGEPAFWAQDSHQKSSCTCPAAQVAALVTTEALPGK